MHQTSLFEPTTFYLIRRAEAAKSLVKNLEVVSSGSNLQNHFCFVYEGDNPPTALKTALTKLNALMIPCFVPWPNEIPQVIRDLAESCGISLSSDAIQLLIDAHGLDLEKNRNELRRLQFLLVTKANTLSALDLAPHLDLIRTEEILQLERLLLRRQWPQAYAIAVNLLNNGEKALPLIAALAGYCRNMMRLIAAQGSGLSAQALAAATDLPPHVVKNYTPYLQGASSTSSYEHALSFCHNADVLIKSTRMSEDLIVAKIIDALAAT